MEKNKLSKIKDFIRNNINLSKIKDFIRNNINPYNFDTFLRKLPNDSTILDVGCGNNSPRRVKKILPHSYYIGIDIQNYNQQSAELADEYHIVDKSKFNKKISSFKNIDVVISYHNLEHVDNRAVTFKAMRDCLKKKGIIYLVTPSEKSIYFPSRKGTLNYFDDSTHKENPVSFNWILEELKNDKFQIIKSIKAYKPIFYYMIGLLKEFTTPKVTDFYAWCFYGFESIVITKKIND